MEARIELSKRADAQPAFERIVFGEVLLPEFENSHGEIFTKEAIRDSAYAFMRAGFIIDIEHDNIDVSDRVHVIESFIARAGDPDFVEGSWVVGLQIDDETIWKDIVEGRLNGYSFEAMIRTLEVEMDADFVEEVTGETEPDPFDGHTHTFLAILNSELKVVSGGTSEVNGHSHPISTHSFTDTNAKHRHRYNLMRVEDNGS